MLYTILVYLCDTGKMIYALNVFICIIMIIMVCPSKVIISLNKAMFVKCLEAIKRILPLGYFVYTGIMSYKFFIL